MVSTDNTPVPDYPGLLRLDGKRFVVVGAGQGIGRQTSHALASVGAKLLCVDNRDDLAKEISEEVGGVPFVADATKREDADAAVAACVSEFGGIDGMVDIVGMARYGDAVDTSDDDWNWTFDMVLRHAYVFSQAAAKAMTDGGAMVFVASVSGISSAPRHAAYGAAKAGLLNLTGTLAVDYAPKVRVNAVTAGLVKTEQSHLFYGDEEGIAAVGATVPLGRMAEPSDVADVCLFLASPLSRYVTGESIVVHGGGEWPAYMSAAKPAPSS